MNDLACFYFPTKTILVDDDVRFLDALVPNISNLNGNYKLFDNPNIALDYLNQNHDKPHFKNNSVKDLCTTDLEHRTVDYSIFELHKEIYNEARFDEVSLLVVDYNMPQQNGLEFCKKIKNPFIKKILLTGEGDEKLAVEAFNSGLIDYFVKKSGKDTFEHLNDAIQQCRDKYFSEVTKRLYQSIISSDEEETALNDDLFKEFFRNLVTEKEIKEYYLLEGTGSFLLVDFKGNTIGLYLRSKDQLRALEEIASDIGIDSSLLKEMKSGEKMLCFTPKKGESLPNPDQWGDYLGEIREIPGVDLKYAIRAVSLPL